MSNGINCVLFLAPFMVVIESSWFVYMIVYVLLISCYGVWQKFLGFEWSCMVCLWLYYCCMFVCVVWKRCDGSWWILMLFYDCWVLFMVWNLDYQSICFYRMFGKLSSGSHENDRTDIILLWRPRKWPNKYNVAVAATRMTHKI